MRLNLKALLDSIISTTPYQDDQVLERILTTTSRNRTARRGFQIIVRSSFHVTIVVSILAFSVLASTLVTLQNSQTAVARYVAVWEEEIARNLLLAQDTELLEKVLAQISDLAPEVLAATGTTPICGERELKQKVPITLYGTPAGGLTICRSPTRLALESLKSPVFLIGIILGGLIFLWHRRRTNAERASLATSSAIEGLSKQVAHDLRSPLGALKIIGSHLAPTSDNEALVQVLQSSILRITQIAEDLLEKSKDTSPSCLPTKKLICNAIRDVVKEMKLNAESKGVQLTFAEFVPNEIESERSVLLSPKVQHRDLARVVSNLIQNALEAPNARLVNIATREVPSGFEIEIADNGTGIPKKTWQTFGRRGFTFGKSRGNGLGVANAKEWMESVGGRLRVRSSRAAGTTVVLTLPR